MVAPFREFSMFFVLQDGRVMIFFVNFFFAFFNSPFGVVSPRVSK